MNKYEKYLVSSNGEDKRGIIVLDGGTIACRDCALVWGMLHGIGDVISAHLAYWDDDTSWELLSGGHIRLPMRGERSCGH